MQWILSEYFLLNLYCYYRLQIEVCSIASLLMEAIIKTVCVTVANKVYAKYMFTLFYVRLILSAMYLGTRLRA